MATDNPHDTRPDTSHSALDFNPFRDLTKTFEQFKMPGLDSNAFIEARRKDVEALVHANQIAYEALQALAKTQSDMLTQALQGLHASAQSGLLAGTHPAKGVSQPADAAHQAWQRMLGDMQRLTAMVQKAQLEATQGLTERAQASLHEMQSLAHKSPVPLR
jgi:hypothetical protein